MTERVSDEWLDELVDAWSASELEMFLTFQKAEILAALRELQERRAADNEGAGVGSVYTHLAKRFDRKGNYKRSGG